MTLIDILQSAFFKCSKDLSRDLIVWQAQCAKEQRQNAHKAGQQEEFLFTMLPQRERRGGRRKQKYFIKAQIHSIGIFILRLSTIALIWISHCAVMIGRSDFLQEFFLACDKRFQVLACIVGCSIHAKNGLSSSNRMCSGLTSHSILCPHGVQT